MTTPSERASAEQGQAQKPATLTELRDFQRMADLQGNQSLFTYLGVLIQQEEKAQA